MLDVKAKRPPPPTPTVFVGEALKGLRLTGSAIPGLDYIKAPNLTVLKLQDSSRLVLSVVKLFDFFDASPYLKDILIHSFLVHAFPPPDRKVTLSHAQRITLFTDHAPRVASHLVCPSIMDTRLSDLLPNDPDASVFPPELQWLLRQYSIEVINNILIHVLDRDEQQSCSLQFRGPSGTLFQITRKTTYNPDPPPLISDDMWPFAILFNRVASALLSLPLGQVVVFTAVMQEESSFAVDPKPIRRKLAEVFEKCLDLQEVVLELYRPGYFPDISGERMPPIQAIVIKHSRDISWGELVENVTEAARVRHSGGAPLERIEIFTTEEHPRIEELESLVREVEYRVGDL